MRSISLFCLLLISPLLCADVKLPSELKGEPGEWIVIVPEFKDGGDIKWKLGQGLSQIDLGKLFPGVKTSGIVVKGQAGTTAEVWAWNAKDNVASDISVCKIIIGGSPVPPTPPNPPDPPTPSVSPIAGSGFRVLIVEETADRAKLPAKQLSILFDKSIRDYLRLKTAKDTDNPTGAWRIWDKDTDASGDTKSWQDAMKRERKSLPWIIISDGSSGYEGPLPSSVEETMNLLKKWGK